MTTYQPEPHQPVARQDTAEVKYAVTYLRVSTTEQSRKGGTNEGYSIPAQRDATRKTAHTHGAFVVKEFVDAGASGTSMNRAGLQELLVFVEENRIDYVIVHKLDRLARSRKDDAIIADRLQQAGVALLSTSESIDASPGGELVHGIMASIAEFYSRNLSNEVMKGMRKKHEAGGTPGKAPLGYVNVRVAGPDGGEHRTVEIDEKRAPLIRWAFYEYAQGKTSLRELAESLSLLGMRGSVDADGGAEVRVNVVHKMLRNPYYKGVVRWGGVEHAGAHTPLMDAGTWQRVQERLDERRNTPNPRAKHPHHLSRVLKCGECGYAMVVSRSRSQSGKIYPYFVCSGRANRRAVCGMKAVLIKTVERLVEDLYRQVSLTREQYCRLKRVENPSAVAPESQSTSSLENIMERRRKILDAYYREAITLEVLQQELERLHSQADAQQEEHRSRDSSEHLGLETRLGLIGRYAASSQDGRAVLHRAVFGGLLLRRGEDGTHLIAGNLDVPIGKEGTATPL